MTQDWNSQNSDDDVQMPLGVASEGGDYIPASTKPKVGGSTLALIGAFALGLAVIYGLGIHAMPRAASAESVAHQQEVQSAITELLQKNGKAEQIAGLLRDTDKLVAMFYSYLGNDHSQRPALPHDPFANEEVKVAAPATPGAEAVAIVSTDAVEAEKLRKVAETFSSLKLQTVMLGRHPAAMINNNMITVGGRIGEFTVTDIQTDKVILSYNTSKFELKLNRAGLGLQ